jgi:hypothetical protein
MGKPDTIPETTRKVRKPYGFTFCPFCGKRLRHGTYSIGVRKFNTYTVCDSCDIQLI